jgi:hypothetical protein
MANVFVQSSNTGIDDQPRLQAQLDAIDAAGGGILTLGPGDYYIGPSDGASGSNGNHSLQLGDNTTLEMADGCRLIKRCVGGYITPVIRNKGDDEFDATSNIRVVGGEIAVLNSANTGRLMVFGNVAGLSVERVKFRGVYGDWVFTAGDCTDVNIEALDIDAGDSIGEDGIHCAGCQRLIIRNCNIKSGDDAIAIHNEASTQNAMYDVLIENCYLESAVANMIRIEVTPDSELPIRRVVVRNITGKAGAGGLRIEDENDAYLVSDVDVSGMLIDCAAATSAGGFYTRGSQRVTLNGVVVNDPIEGSQIDGGDTITLNDCIVRNPRAGGGLTQRCLTIATAHPCSNIRIVGGLYEGAQTNASGIHVGGGNGNNVDGFEISGVTVKDAGLDCIRITNGQRGRIEGNQCTGALNAYGIREISFGATPGIFNNLYVGNQCYSNATNSAIPTIAANGSVVVGAGTPGNILV